MISLQEKGMGHDRHRANRPMVSDNAVQNWTELGPSVVGAAATRGLEPRAETLKEGQMAAQLSPRLQAIVDALPLRPGMRVLEIGCGPGAAAREITRRIGHGHVLAIDRSAKAIAQAHSASSAEIAAGRLSLRQVAAEDFELGPGEAPFDIAVAVRVGALDGRHPEAGRRAITRIAAALTASGRLFIDGGNPLREIPIERSH